MTGREVRSAGREDDHPYLVIGLCATKCVVELDHPATQHDKRTRLDRLGIDTSAIGFAAADFTTDLGAGFGLAGPVVLAAAGATGAGLVIVAKVGVEAAGAEVEDFAVADFALDWALNPVAVDAEAGATA